MENKKYSMLLIALYCHEGHVKRMIEYLKLRNPLIDLSLLTEKVDVMEKVISDKSINIIKYDVSSPSNRIKFRWLRFLMIKYKQRRFFAKLCKGRRYDVVNIHFANKYMSYVYQYLRAMSNNLVISPWGSDVLRRDSLTLKQLSKIYNSADYITTFPQSILGRKIIEEMGVNPEKLIGNFFGSEIVDYAINNGENITQNEAKDFWSLQDRFVITCGYNGNPAQRHLTIIDAIGYVKDLLPSNLTLLFPMTYGGKKKPEYIQMCKERCKKDKLNAVFITDFLSVEELYKLRKATDIFVHIQTTDASSASVKEYILCDKKIVHGSWIKYPELERFSPLFYYPVDNLEKLGDVIVHAYNSEKINQSKELIDFVKSRGWETTSTKMNDFYASIVKNK